VDDGLRAIEEHAATLMREIATEMWRSSGGDTADEQDRILSFISRDQAIKSLIAASDDRFQALALRTARLEDALAELAENGRLVREAIQLSANSVHEIANSPTLQGVEMIRTQLEQVEAHISATFAHLDERDKNLTGAIQQRIVEHGDLIARETARIVEAMESYVQGGAEAMGRLAQRIEQHAAAFATHDETLAEKVRATIAATASPQVTRDLLRRPPRLPANVTVPKAKVLNVVPGPKHGDVYTLSVSLLRVGITSELRLGVQREKGSDKWQVTETLG